MGNRHEAIIETLRSRGFHLASQTSALAFLTHPDHPGVEVRIGTVFVVIERDGVELYRVRHQEFDVTTALRRLSGLHAPDSEPG